MKSRRGVMIVDSLGRRVAGGFNGAPHANLNGDLAFECDGSERCRKLCAQRCVHAEMRALSELRAELGETYRILHVKIGEDGMVVPGGPPSCAECAKAILDAEHINGVWLCQVGALGEWRYYTRLEFYAETMKNLKLI